MSRIFRKILWSVAVLVILGFLAYPKVKPLLSAGEDQSGEQTDENPLRVNVTVVQEETARNKIFTTGTVLANEEVELRSEVSGKISEIYLEEGQKIEKGELLLKVNDSELQAQLKRARFRLELALKRERRQKKLLEKDGISQEDYDATLNEVNVLKSEIELIEAQIDKTEIWSPFDGTVGLKYVSEGSYISPSTRIASLQNINPVKVDFSIPERYLNKVEEGDKITFTVEGTDQSFQGEVYAIEPKIDSQTRTLQMRALSDNPGNLLVPGAFASLELTLETIEDALMIPSIALVPEIQGQKVYLYKEGRVVEQRVETGIRTEEKVQIVEGVQAGDTVLTTGFLQVQPGMEVTLNTIE